MKNSFKVFWYVLVATFVMSVVSHFMRYDVATYFSGLAWRCFLLAASVIGISAIWLKVGNRFGIGSEYVLLAMPIIQLTLVLSGLLIGPVATLALLYTLGLTSLAVLLVAWIRGAGPHSTWTEKAALCGILALVAIATFECMVGEGYGTPILSDVALLGAAHPDSLFKGAYTYLFKNYSVLSIGADGLVPLKYHALDGIVYAAVSSWIGGTPLEALGLATLVVFVPLLWFNAFVASSALTQSNSAAGEWLLATLAIVFGIFSRTVSVDFLVSESALLAGCVLLPALPLAARVWTRSEDIRVVPAIIGLLLVTSFLFFTKISHGTFLAFIVITLSWYRIRNKVAGIGLVVATVLIVAAAFFLLVPPNRQEVVGGPAVLGGILSSPLKFLQLISIVALCALALVGCSVRFSVSNLTAFVMRPAPNLASLLCLVTPASILPSLLVGMFADVYYFLLPSVQTALLFVVAFHVPDMHRWWQERSDNISLGTGWWLTVPFGVLLIAPSVRSGDLFSFVKLTQTRDYVVAAIEHAAHRGRPIDPVHLKVVHEEVEDDVRRSIQEDQRVWPGARLDTNHDNVIGGIVSTIRECEARLRASGEDPLNFAVFIPDEHPYWSNFQADNYEFFRAGLQIQALAGHPLVAGVPDHVNDRGFDGYSASRSGHLTRQAGSDEGLCRRLDGSISKVLSIPIDTVVDREVPALVACD